MSDGGSFPQQFLWGAATAAYQVEGSPLSDGAGRSIWHRFAHTPGRIRDGDTGDLACDHYRRFREDVALMRELGLTAYRFSIAWARVMPEGTGAVNPKGLDYYQRLVDELLAAGIEPMATLYHWDLPAALDDRGGWLNPDVAEWFAEYSRVVFRRLDGRVKLWATLNEPWVVTDGGYLRGALAPGHRSAFEAPRASHNLMKAHAASVAAYRAEGSHRIGLVVNIEPKYPASASADDAAATKRADAYMNRQYLDAALLGQYPAELAEVFGATTATRSKFLVIPTSCETHSSVASRQMRRARSRSLRRLSRSSPRNGSSSSASRTCGLSMARPSRTRWPWPAETSPPFSPSLVCKPSGSASRTLCRSASTKTSPSESGCSDAMP